MTKLKLPLKVIHRTSMLLLFAAILLMTVIGFSCSVYISIVNANTTLVAFWVAPFFLLGWGFFDLRETNKYRAQCIYYSYVVKRSETIIEKSKKMEADDRFEQEEIDFVDDMGWCFENGFRKEPVIRPWLLIGCQIVSETYAKHSYELAEKKNEHAERCP